MQPIPQTDPKAGYLAHKTEIDAAIARALDGGWYIGGAEVQAFEREFAAWAGTAEAVACASGTDALVLSLKGLGIGRGDRVATVSHTAVATVAAIEIAGAEPVLLDIDEFYCLDPAALEAALKASDGKRIRAVVPVHLYGQPVAMDDVLQLARAHGLKVLEDCAQAHGATLGGKKIGTFGDIAAFSLYPTKNLGALGDAGVIATDDRALAERLRALREYGWRERYISAEAGMNSRLDPLQAAILRVKLKHLDADNARRQAIACAYDKELGDVARLTTPAVRPGASHVYHQYVVRHPDRDGLRDRLKAVGIGTNVHYPAPVHLQPAYQGRTPIGLTGLAVTEKLLPQVLSLPMYPQMSDGDVERVVTAVRQTA